MSGLRFGRRGLPLIGIIGAVLLVASPALGQDNAKHGTDRDALLDLTITDAASGTGGTARFLNDIVLTKLHDPASDLLGATLQPVGEALRTQLGIPAGQGLVVASVVAEGPSAQAGLRQNDILLLLSNKPLAAAADLNKQLKAAGESAAPLVLLRGGKRVTLQVRPVYRVTLGPAAQKKTEYFIGVQIDPVDEPLRSQLGLPKGSGVIVSDVIGGSPAEKAGIKKYDVILDIGGKPIPSPETLARQVQTNRDRPTTMKIMRGGKPQTIHVTATERKVNTFQVNPVTEITVPLEYWTKAEKELATATEAVWRDSLRQNVVDDVRTRLAKLEQELKRLQRIETLEKEVKALHAAVDKLNGTLKDHSGKRRD